MLKRLYVPVCTLILVLGVGNYWAIHSHFDPQTAAQEERLHFKTEATTVAQGTDLTPAEVEAARQVVREIWKAPASGRPTLMYSGDSQTLAIMDGTNADLLAGQRLQVLIRRNSSSTPGGDGGMDVRLASLPNLSPAETLVILAAMAERSPRGVDAVLIGQALREFRTVSVRDDLLPLLTPEVRARLKALAEQCGDLPAAVALIDEVDKPATVLQTATESRGTVASRLDRQVNRWADAMPLFEKREDLHAELKVLIYRARNAAFGVNSASARAVPEPLYQANLQMLEMTLRYARSMNVPVYGYLAPIRPIQPNPNKKSDVVKFRRDVPAVFAKYGAPIKDYTGLIEEPLWTNHDDAHDALRDFDHFTGRGHQKLAETIFNDFGAPLAAIAMRRSKKPPSAVVSP